MSLSRVVFFRVKVQRKFALVIRNGKVYVCFAIALQFICAWLRERHSERGTSVENAGAHCRPEQAEHRVLPCHYCESFGTMKWEETRQKMFCCYAVGAVYVRIILFQRKFAPGGSRRMVLSHGLRGVAAAYCTRLISYRFRSNNVRI